MSSFLIETTNVKHSYYNSTNKTYIHRKYCENHAFKLIIISKPSSIFKFSAEAGARE